ncbi:polysaccharide pyruvyl transferase family protein [Aerosakkonemataceae cyanobacterium BLCC-F154]|uniref:Polysaccharide pyruvyl transferase family protein n=1 Tax=Floridaenema fluviatile BLCC-F154 TaxID=3153640 RepID=A0ABV4YIL7_9CYAN
MKILVAGWFSYKKCNVTAGDLMAKDLVCEWIEGAGYPYDVALAPPLMGGVDWQLVNPDDYSHAVFVCGPFPYMNLTVDFLERFKKCRLIGIDLSMIEPVNIWNPFDVLIARDSSEQNHPDITFLSSQPKVPVVGIILVHPQQEYKEKCKHEIANQAIEDLIQSREMVAVRIDTGLDPNTSNLRTAAEIDSLIGRMDLVITTRLHGTVLALKNGVPVIAIDAISGGAKVLRQTKTIGWPIVFSVDRLSAQELDRAFDYCQTEAAKQEAKECRVRAAKAVEEVREEFISSLNSNSLSASRIWREESLDKSALASPSMAKVMLYRAIGLKKRTTKAIGNWILSL